MENMKIMTSVGVGGKNKQHDVEAVQTALNQLNSLIKPIKILVVDGKLGTRPESSKTVIAIKAFQQKVVGSIRPDGRIDLNGRTHKLINAKLCVSNPPHSNSLLFPLKQRPQFSYKQGPRAFGSNRSGGRKHAGCDLYATSGTDIRAIADGTVTAIYYFYLGTNTKRI